MEKDSFLYENKKKNNFVQNENQNLKSVLSHYEEKIAELNKM